MARISSPLEGQIVNINAQTVSRQVISGGGGRGVDVGGGGGGGSGTERGGAIIVRPQTSLVDRVQNLQIQQTQQSVSSIQPTLDVIRVNVQVLSNGITNLSKQLLLEGQVEQKNLKDEQESERKLNERQIRAGRESLLERRITQALATPVLNIQKKVVGLFDRIMGAMTTLFFGWLTNQGIETLKALTSGDTKKLEEIKNSVIKNVLFAIGAFAAIKIGFGLVMRTITALTFRIAGLGAKLALAPFRAAGTAIARLFGFGGKTASPASKVGKVPITSSGGKVLSRGGNFLDKFLGATTNLGKGATGFLRGAGNVASKVFTPLALATGTYRIAKGDITGGLLSYGSALPVVGLGFAGLDIAREMGFGKGTFFGKKDEQSTTKISTPTSTQSATPSTPPAVQPQTSAVPQPNEISFSVDTTNKLNPFNTQTADTQESTSTFDMKNFEGLSQTSTDTTKKVSPAKVQSPPKPATPVGSLPEPKPNIILAGGGKDRTQVMSAPQQEPLTDVPLIPSGNTDNFYVLYSQLNYNVVM